MTIEQRRARNAEKQRAWRAHNRERANAIAAACRRRNRAKIAASWKIYYEKNKATLYEKKKSYLARNGEKLRQWKRADYERHRESYIARSHRRWREKNDECRAYEAKRYRRDKLVIHTRQRDYASRNREKILAWRRSYLKTPRGRAVRQASDRRCAARAAAYKAEWARRNRERLSQYLCIYFRERSRSDPAFAIRLRLRSRLVATIRRLMTGRSATGVIRELLGCSESELVRHLESKFLPGMSWDNRNQWHIDHIKPLCAFDLTDPEQQALAFHYTNLQPLWAGDNMRKGGRYGGVEITLPSKAERDSP
jgi:hypothetical protein